jgi:hypothetical protein
MQNVNKKEMEMGEMEMEWKWNGNGMEMREMGSATILNPAVGISKLTVSVHLFCFKAVG